ncbi:hypothetical protein Tco_0602732, partial [Tanacetum coccineum]
GGDDADDESSDDADDDDDDVEDDEEEEHLALTDFYIIPTIDYVPLAEDTKAFETDESAPTPPLPAYRTTPRISVRSQAPIPFPFEAKV